MTFLRSLRPGPLNRGPCSRRETKHDLAGEGPVLGEGIWSLGVNPGSGNRDVEGTGILDSEVEATGDGVRDSEVVDCRSRKGLLETGSFSRRF